MNNVREDDIDSIIRNVADGKVTSDSVIDSITNKSTSTATKNIPEQVIGDIPIILVPEQLQDDNPSERNYTLSDLRPPDRFRFEKIVPHPMCDLHTEYELIPARKGAVGFSNQRHDNYIVLPLISGHMYPVILTSPDTVDPGKRFHPADRIKFTDGNYRWRGEIVSRSQGMNYWVMPDPPDGDHDDGQGVQNIVHTKLRLYDKPGTTKKYIQVEKDGRFKVKFGGGIGDKAISYEDNLTNALRILKTKNPTAFNRFSKFLHENRDSTVSKYIDDKVLQYLKEADEKFWGLEKKHDSGSFRSRS